jgi:hypothetical protein
MSSKQPSFLVQYVRVVVAAAMVVVVIAFLSIPVSLGEHPGEPRIAQAAGTRHMT